MKSVLKALRQGLRIAVVPMQVRVIETAKTNCSMIVKKASQIFSVHAYVIAKNGGTARHPNRRRRCLLAGAVVSELSVRITWSHSYDR
jgi:hypothetical protein